MKTIKITLTLTSLFFIVNISKAQVGISYLHSEVISTLGISTNPEKRFWGEARVGLNVNDISPEVMAYYNVVRRDNFNLFAGAGARVVTLENIILPAIGFTVKPFEKLNDLAIHAEGAVNTGGEGGGFTRGLIGLRYFIRKKGK